MVFELYDHPASYPAFVKKVDPSVQAMPSHDCGCGCSGKCTSGRKKKIAFVAVVVAIIAIVFYVIKSRK